MVAFWIILFIALFALWVLCAFLYSPVGKFFYKLWNDWEKGMEIKKDTSSYKETKEK